MIIFVKEYRKIKQHLYFYMNSFFIFKNVLLVLLCHCHYIIVFESNKKNCKWTCLQKQNAIVCMCVYLFVSMCVSFACLACEPLTCKTVYSTETDESTLSIYLSQTLTVLRTNTFCLVNINQIQKVNVSHFTLKNIIFLIKKKQRTVVVFFAVTLFGQVSREDFFTFPLSTDRFSAPSM